MPKKSRKPKSSQSNPHCPVPGCKTKSKHTDDPIVAAMCSGLADHAQHVTYVSAGIASIRNVIDQCFLNNEPFVGYSLVRAPEELYTRCLYTLFLAPDDHIPHIVSGAMPNGFAAYYREVNKEIYRGTGELENEQPGSAFGSFTAMGTINQGAHIAYGHIFAMLGLIKLQPEKLPEIREKLFKHFTTYLTYLTYLRDCFSGGKDKATCLDIIRQLHKKR